MAGFASQCNAMQTLLDDVAASGPAASGPALTAATHRLSGLAGTIGFPTTSARASDLERLLDPRAPVFDAAKAYAALAAIRTAFVDDLASPPTWALPAAQASNGAKILVAEDEADQRAIVTTCLEGAGYQPIAVGSGDLVVQAARTERPELILLDIAMPHLDGYSVCRLLKADPDLAGIPVMFMTTGANLDDRLAGLTLGADEFLSKPVDMRELVLRVQLLIERSQARRPAAAPVAASRHLAYDAFLAHAARDLERAPAALAILRIPADGRDRGIAILAEEVRGRDTLGAYGPARVLILMPEMTAAEARDRVDVAMARLAAQGLTAVAAGVTSSHEAPIKTVEALIAQAEEALAEATYLGAPSAAWTERSSRPAAPPIARTVVIAEDDPDIVRLIDAQMKAAGHRTVLAFDGEQALAAVRAHAAGMLVLDLMMPKLNGFDVLTTLRESPETRRRIIVLSGRGREEDVVRAFALGADDYMTKPFNPQELMARVTRLLRS